MTTTTKTKSEVRQGREKLESPGLEEYGRLVRQMFAPKLNVRTRGIETKVGVLSDEKFDNLNVSVAEDHGLKMSKGALQSSIRSSAEDSAYDPIDRYLNGLAKGPSDVLSDDEWERIAELCFGVDGEFERKVLQKFLVSAVKRIFEPGCECHFAMILKGEQGIGKSQFFKILAGEWFTDSMGDLQKVKDDCLILHMHWIAEWGEIDQVFGGARASERMKRFVSSSADALRVPYGRNTVVYPRRSVIVGTTNRDDWATDFTGNRRFPVIEPKTVNREWVQADRDRIWGRAVVEARRGTQDWFTQEEGKEISRRTAAYAPEDIHASDALAWLEARKGEWFAARDIAMGALEWEKEKCNNANLRALSRSLHALATQGVETTRRSHKPTNGLWGGKSTKNCWRVPE